MGMDALEARENLKREGGGDGALSLVEQQRVASLRDKEIADLRSQQAVLAREVADLKSANEKLTASNLRTQKQLTRLGTEQDALSLWTSVVLTCHLHTTADLNDIGRALFNC